MIALIRAELRKNWKTKKFLIAILCFLCFMACSYILCLQKDTRYHQEKALDLHYEYAVADSVGGELLFQMSSMKVEEEPPTMRASYNLWQKAYQLTYDFIYLRQAPEYFGDDVVTRGMYDQSKAIYDVRTSPYYKNELDASERSLQDVKNDIHVYTYLRKHKINAYSSPYEPTLANFIVQLFQNEAIILLIMVSAFFIIDSICHDFDSGSYKNVYIVPLKRSRIMGAKVVSSIMMISLSFIISLLLFSLIPLFQHGMGSFQYPYMLHDQMILYAALLGKLFPFLLLVLVFYMAVCVLAASIFKNTTNAMLCMSGVLLIVYLSVQFFGIHNSLITWLPFYYLYPLDIISGGYDYSLLFCYLFCVAALICVVLFYHRKLEKVDLKGSDAS